MNLFYGNLDERFKKFQVYNVQTMGMDDFMVVSGMPNVIGEFLKENNANSIYFKESHKKGLVPTFYHQTSYMQNGPSSMVNKDYSFLTQYMI